MSVRPTIYPLIDIEPIRQAIGSGDSSLIERVREAYIRVEEERSREDELLDDELLDQDEFADELEPWELDEEELRDLTKLTKAFVNGKYVRNREPGIWRQVIVYLAHALGLTSSIHPLFDEWSRDAWSEYLAGISTELPEGPRRSLVHLVEGRSLTGREIERDGSSFAWLTSSEASELLNSLRAVPPDCVQAFGEDWLRDFHGELIECLSACEGRCLLLAG